jgi:antitoxin FitA
MATIQLRGVPEDVHRIHRRRAAEAGMSLQEYLLAELIESARTRTPAEVVADVGQQLRGTDGEGFSPNSSVDVIRADRDAH